ncbi:MAG: ROK family transcriptional regulator [Specibacter sp.]
MAAHSPLATSTTSRPQALAVSDSAMDMLALVAAETTVSRAQLARVLKLAPSTVSLRVNELLDAGLVVESGEGSSTGGRKPRSLQLNHQAGHVLVADFGSRHVRVGMMDLSGSLLATETGTIDVAAGPEATLATIAALMENLASGNSSGVLRGIGMALPGPVDYAAGWVDSPARMPGWHRFPIRDWMSAHFNVPVFCDNDANMMALAEHALRQNSEEYPKKPVNTLFIKAGAAIGCGLVANGEVYRGSTGTAGDITHVRVKAAGERACTCGNLGCLETIASGSAVVAELMAKGVNVADLKDVVELANMADANATTSVRTAGRMLGEMLCSIVNFVNPDHVILGGALSQVEPYVAAIRSQLYEGCHPLATKNLTIEKSIAGPQAGMIGVGLLSLRELLRTNVLMPQLD